MLACGVMTGDSLTQSTYFGQKHIPNNEHISAKTPKRKAYADLRRTSVPEPRFQRQLLRKQQEAQYSISINSDLDCKSICQGPPCEFNRSTVARMSY